MCSLSARPRPFFLVAGLTYLSRPDLLLIVAPLALFHLWGCGSHRERARLLALAATPIAAWTVFSLVYDGAPFPNTAYAKLLTGVPPMDAVVQGLRYLENSLRSDPLTLAGIGAAVAIAFARGDRTDASLAAGALLYLA